jgi:hypothetical protein
VAGANGVIALSKAAPALPDDLRKILQVDPTLATVREAATGKTADLSLNDIEFDPVIREPHATWALALNYKLHLEETGLTTSLEFPQIFLRMPICQVGHKMTLWAPSPKIAPAARRKNCRRGSFMPIPRGRAIDRLSDWQPTRKGGDVAAARRRGGRMAARGEAGHLIGSGRGRGNGTARLT